MPELLGKKCGGSMSSCPAVYDPQDGSGELIIVGRGPLTPVDEGVHVSEGEAVVRLPRAIVEAALSK
jgi:hypothetical protein